MNKDLPALEILCCLLNPKIRPTMEPVVQIFQQIDDTDKLNAITSVLLIVLMQLHMVLVTTS